MTKDEEKQPEPEAPVNEEQEKKQDPVEKEETRFPEPYFYHVTKAPSEEAPPAEPPVPSKKRSLLKTMWEKMQ
ncbi:hypothetical protein [Salibacterium lacus]|uniref:Uncharacterized protein n=1 Tax=Salibacterium lacus TaxID=1898109 RepID=A0ABW5T3I7_9BACI